MSEGGGGGGRGGGGGGGGGDVNVDAQKCIERSFKSEGDEVELEGSSGTLKGTTTTTTTSTTAATTTSMTATTTMEGSDDNELIDTSDGLKDTSQLDLCDLDRRPLSPPLPPPLLLPSPLSPPLSPPSPPLPSLPPPPLLPLPPDSSSESQAAPLDTAALDPALEPSPCRPRSKARKRDGKDSKDSDSSVSSRKRASKSKAKIKSKFAAGSLDYIEERLRGRVFSGWVEERRWVEGVGGYRDVIEVDEWEVEMNHQLQAIVSSIQGVQDGTKWINITPPRDGPYYCLWVLLEAPPTPGHYWYTITGVKLQPQFGLMISVKEIRSIHPHDGELAAARRERLKRASQGAARSELDSVSDVLHDWAHQLSALRPAALLSVITSTLTLSNIKETIRFLVVLVMTLVIGLVTFVRESHVVGLRFVREAGIFFHNATPFLQTVLGFFEKIVGGLYLLVAMVYRDLRRPSAPPRLPPPPPPPSLALTPGPQVLPSGPSSRPALGPRAAQFVPPERWVIRTQNNDFT